MYIGESVYPDFEASLQSGAYCSPNPTFAKMRQISMMFDAQIVILDKLIAEAEAQNRRNPVNVYRQEQGKRLIESLQQETENQSLT